MIEPFLASLRTQGRSAHTLAAYESDLKLAGLAPEAEPKAIEAWIATRMDLDAPATLRRRVGTLKTYYGWLVHTGRIQANPMTRVCWQPKKIRRLPRYLEAADIERMLALRVDSEPIKRAQLLLAVLWWTGARISEVLGLRVGDLGVDTLRVLGKGGVERMAPCSVELMAAMRAQADPYGQIFPYSVATARRGLKLLAYSAGIKDRIYPHLIRHSLATALVEGGANLLLIQEWLGHARVETTQIYAHVKASTFARTAHSLHPSARAKVSANA
jgi:site-specific recombinase XerD